MVGIVAQRIQEVLEKDQKHFTIDDFEKWFKSPELHFILESFLDDFRTFYKEKVDQIKM